jgi:hypothetical protein
MDINEILIEITTKGSVYDEIINNLLTPRVDLKPELISELSISFLENKKKIEEVYELGYFKYYFINAVKNQVHSNTSSFHKNIRIQDYEFYEEFLDIKDDDDLDMKILFEEKLDRVNEVYKGVKKSWFEDKMWEEYFINNKTYREIEREYGLDHCLVFHNVKKVKDKIIKQIKDEGV